MYERLLNFLRCPECGQTLEVEPLAWGGNGSGVEIVDGLMSCEQHHSFPVIGGIPRMLPGALQEHRHRLSGYRRASAKLQSEQGPESRRSPGYDLRTRENFSLEWDHHELGGRTWGMELDQRVQGFFLNPIRIPTEELDGLVMLDAGCGNGSQSVVYTEYGLEVIAMDISSGLEHGHAFRHLRAGARPDRVHFVQADLQAPPLAPETVDIIHSAGVLHHTPDTEGTFRCLAPLVRPGGTFFIWLYAYEPVVTPIVNTLRAVTTRLPSAAFAQVARLLAGTFQVFVATVDVLGIRSYPRMTRREAALALMDIFGAPYAHYHSFPEVARWYAEAGFDEVWECTPSRRGFGACGTRAKTP